MKKTSVGTFCNVLPLRNRCTTEAMTIINFPLKLLSHTLPLEEGNKTSS